MALTFQLTDGTTTVDLNDSSNIQALQSTLNTPPPRLRTSYSGASLSRHGSDLIASKYENRTVTVGLKISGTLSTNIQAVWDILRKAEEFEKFGLGSRVQLQFQQDAGTTYYFNVITGFLDLGRGWYNAAVAVNTTITTAVLTLVCQPLIEGTAETLENYLDDPGCEAGLDDWTVSNGSSTFDTTSPVEGARWGKSVLNASAAQFQVSQVQTMTAGNHVFTCTYNITGNQSYEAFISDAGGTTTSALTADGTNRTVTVTRDSGANTAITCGIRTTGAVTDNDDVVLIDKAYLGDGTTAPTAWVSGRKVYNNWADGAETNQQSARNFLDMESIPGDVGAALQIKATENEAHTAFWVGARHADRQRDAGLWHEGEGFSNPAEWNALADASSSSGEYGNFDRTVGSMSVSASAPEVTTKAISTPPEGTYRVLARARYHNDSGAIAGTEVSLGAGFAYGDITLTPSVAGHYTALSGIGTDAFAIYDIGSLNIPPLVTPTGATIGTFTLRLAYYQSGSPTSTGAEIDIDWVFLLPVDEGGSIIASKTSAADVVLVDSRSSMQAAYLLNSSDVVQSIPSDQQGQPPTGHPDGTRLYFVSDDGAADINDGWSIAVTILPRYLQVV